MASDLRKLLVRQARELLNLEREQVGKAFALYRAFRADLIDRLDFLDEKGLRLTATRYAKALDQAGDALSDLRKDFTGQLGASVRPIAELAKQHLIEQVVAFGKRFPGALDIKPTIGKPLETALGVLTPQFETNVSGYTSKIETDIRQRLAISLMADEDGQRARQRIVPGYLPALSRSEKPPTVAYWAQKIVTDQATRSTGVVKLQMIEQGTNQKLQKRWCSVLDERTSEICQEMDGVVVEIDEPFELPNGDEVMSPPGHPNCRAFVIPWSEEVAPAAAELEPRAQAEPEKPAAAVLVIQPDMTPAAAAQVVRANAAKVEPTVTSALQGLEGPSAKLVSLKNALKTEDSLTRKIRDEAKEKGITPAEKAGKIKDALRYTMEVTPEKYSEIVPVHLEAMEKQGFAVTDVKNYWKPGAVYQGVNANLTTPEGQIFELQFHTAKSFEAKRATHKEYEEFRLPSTSAERKAEVFTLMQKVQATVDVPSGAYELRYVPLAKRLEQAG